METIEIPFEIFEKFSDKNLELRKQAEKDFKFYVNNYYFSTSIPFESNIDTKTNSPKVVNDKKEQQDNFQILIFRLKNYADLSKPPLLRKGVFISISYLSSILPTINKSIILELVVLLKSFFNDNDPKIISVAAESLYSIIRIHSFILIENFHIFFDSLLVLATNQDSEVKLICMNIDCIMKEKVNFFFEEEVELNFEFSLNSFIECIYSKLVCPDLSVKLLVVSWLTFINSLPDIRLINVFHKFIPTLFEMLDINENCIGLSTSRSVQKLSSSKNKSSKIKEDREFDSVRNMDLNKEFTYTTSIAHSKQEIRNKFIYSENLLKELYEELQTDFDSLTPEEESELLEMLLKYGNKDSRVIKIMIFQWINVFLKKYKENIISCLSKSDNDDMNINYNNSISYFTTPTHFDYLTNKPKPIFEMFQNSQLNHISKDKEYEKLQFNKNYNTDNELSPERGEKDDKVKKSKILKSNNSECSFKNYHNKISEHISIPMSHFPKILDIIIINLAPKADNDELGDLVLKTNNLLIEIIELYPEITKATIIDFENILKKYYSTDNDIILENVIYWINKLFTKFTSDSQVDMDNFISELVSILNHNNNKIFDLLLSNICEISEYRKDYTNKILKLLLYKLKSTPLLMEQKGSIILKKLCSHLSIEKVLFNLCDLLENNTDQKFASKIVSTFDIILINSQEDNIKNLLVGRSIEENLTFFHKIFKIWAVNPVSTLQLALFSEFYDLSLNLVVELGQFELAVEDYLQLALLVQLLESRNFISLRIHLLEPRIYPSLIKTLHGILLLLPHGKAYNALNKRLKIVENIYKIDEYLLDKPRDPIKQDVAEYIRVFKDAKKRKIIN